MCKYLTGCPLIYNSQLKTHTFCISPFIAGVKKSAPDPNPAITTPDARPRLSGNHSINACMGGV